MLTCHLHMQNPDDILFLNDASTADGSANQYVSGQIFFDAFKGRYGHGGGGVVAMGIPMIAMFLCGMSSITSNSRCTGMLVDMHSLHYGMQTDVQLVQQYLPATLKADHLV